ncbi:MAG: hypothetical protein M3N11_06535, partial [Actinomycetota bacterium]|nr:hypothetical protein [Actinomycetota bacterium]
MALTGSAPAGLWALAVGQRRRRPTMGAPPDGQAAAPAGLWALAVGQRRSPPTMAAGGWPAGIAALVAGLLLTAGLPPFGWWPLA